MNFDQIPSNLRVPLAYIEFSNARAVSGTPGMAYKKLLIGQRLSGGAVAAGALVRITSDGAAESAFGRGSMLAEMVKVNLAAERFIETWAIALDEDAAGNAAAGVITLTGPATAAGTINLYVAGTRVRIGVASGAVATDIATALITAINANTTLPVTAAVDGVDAFKVNLTCRWKGETGNDIDLRVNYQTGEVLPAGVGVAFTAMSGGTGNPDVTSALAAMGDEWFNAIAMPFTDTSNLNALRDDLLERWGPMVMQEGIAFAAYRGTHSATGSFGNGRNDHLITIMGTNLSPTAPWIWAAVNTAIAAGSLNVDPARPLQTLRLPGVLPPAPEDRWRLEERNMLLFDGISTYTVDAGGNVLIERQITTYQVNAFDVPDPSYLDVNTPATLGYLRFATRARILQKFPRHKLANDGTRVEPGQAIVTPSDIRNELLVLFRELEAKGLVENFDQYKEDLQVVRDDADKNRINVLGSPDLVNQFRIFAMQMQFIV